MDSSKNKSLRTNKNNKQTNNLRIRDFLSLS